jgi:RND superfamily putative drug exporter
MATLLYRLGRWAYARPWRVIISWLLLIGVVGGLAVGLGGTLKDSFKIPGTESQEALDKLSAVFPQTAGATVTVVLEAPEGDSVEDEPYKTAIDDTVDDLADVDGVESSVSPFSEYAVEAVSDSERVALIQVTLSEQQDDVTQATIDDILATASTGEDAGLNVQYTGGVFQSTSFGVSPTEGLGVVFAGVVLVVAFGSFLAAGMPLVIALVSVAVAMAGLLAAAAFTPVSSTAPVLGLMIGLAVGIDYSLFIISRHRNQLAGSMDPRESTGVAVATAGSAVVFAGITVIIALLGLLVVGIPFLSVMGVGAAGAVLVAVLASMTLLPAILGLAGTRMIPKQGSRAQKRALAAMPGAAEGKPSFGLRWVRGVLKAPIPIAIGLIIGLGALLIPALQLQLSLPDAGSQPRDSSTRQAYDIIADEFGAGRNGPLVVLVDITQTTDVLEDLEDIGDEIGKLDDVAHVGSGIPNATVDTAIIQVIPGSAPDSPATAELVSNIRAMEGQIEDEYGTPIQVTGATAVYSDISSTLMAALLPFGAIVVGLSIILLMMVFRSLFVPITAALGFLLSVIAAFGSVVGVFQLGFGIDLLHVEPGPILSFLPIILIAVLFGLAMDYQVFLVSGMREEYVRTGDAKRSVRVGFAHAARVVTAAALIMFFVFFSFVPEGMAMIKPIALGLAVGILVDAFLIRMTLIPALMAIGGRAAWYLPKWLDRILPDIDIEGTALEAHREGLEWVADQPADVAVTADALVVSGGSDAPLSITATAGSMLLLDGGDDIRRCTLATLSGRAPALAGRAQVARQPLPSDPAAVARRVAVVDAGTADDLASTVHELLMERIALTTPWWAAGRRRSAEKAILDRAARALHAEGLPRMEGHERLDELPRDSRVAFAAAMGAAESTPVVAVDLGEWTGESLQRGLRLLDAILPTTTTILVGVATPVMAQLGSGRPAIMSTLNRKAVLA